MDRKAIAGRLVSLAEELAGESRTAARPRDETDDIIQDHVRALGNSVPDGHWGDVKDVLSVLVGNEADFNASNFVKALKKGNLSRFYVDTRVRLKPVQTGWSMGKVGKRDLVRAVKSLKEALNAGREASGSNAKDIARRLRRMAREVASE